MTLAPLIYRPPYRILARPGQGRALIIAFASIGHDLTRAPSPEFTRSTAPYPTLFVVDEARSWATAPGFSEALTEALTHFPQTRILTLGTSMGAVMALHAAEILPVTSVLAIGPQHNPQDPRWHHFTAQLPTRPTQLAEAPQITLLHGTIDDAAQAQAFPLQRNVDHILFPEQTHSSLAPHLRAKGLLPGLIDAALTQNRRRLLRLTAQAGGQRRRE